MLKDPNMIKSSTQKKRRYAEADAMSSKQLEAYARSAEKRLQQATLQLKEKFGKNSVLKAIDLTKGATAKERNESIGGHKA